MCTLLTCTSILNICFRSECYKEFTLEALRYSSLPAFTWDAMLRFTRAKPALIQDVDMYEFYELGIRGQC